MVPSPSALASRLPSGLNATPNTPYCLPGSVDLAYLRLPPAATAEHLRNAVRRLPASLIQAMISLHSAHSTNPFVI